MAVKMKEEQVAKLNEVNEFVESSLRARPASNPVDKTEKYANLLIEMQKDALLFTATNYANIPCS